MSRPRPAAGGPVYLEMRGITKRYGPVVANDGVSLSLEPGEILAIVGENGAGKSTLMKILYGMERPDSGEIFLDGRPLALRSAGEAITLGIGMVQQHFMLFPSMTAGENIVYGNEPRRGILFDRSACRERVQALCAQYGLQVEPDALVEDCPVGVRQRVEILKILYQNAKLIVFDEPTAVLTPPEVGELLDTIRGLAAAGKAVILITHKLQEALSTAGRIMVMRDGRVVHEALGTATNAEELALHMVGRPVPPSEVAPVRAGETLLSVRDLRLSDRYGRRRLKGVSLRVARGEIVGIAGVAGNGQSELARCVTGMERADAGSIRLLGHELSGRDVAGFRRAGVAHIPEDRGAWGTAARASLWANALMGRQRGYGLDIHGVLRRGRIYRYTAELLREYGVRAASVFQRIRELSGGNVQKLIAARELSYGSCLLVACEPTRGVDIGAREFLHGGLLKKRARGDGILLISSELSEILKLSDRIYVFYEGRIQGEFSRDSVTQQELGLLMTGGSVEDGA